MEVVRDEVSGSFLPSSISASDPSSCSELSARRFASKWAEGKDKLLKATFVDEGMEEVGRG